MLISYDSNYTCDAASKEYGEYDVLWAVNSDKMQDTKAQSQLGPGLKRNKQEMKENEAVHWIRMLRCIQIPTIRSSHGT